jgi:methyltransferase (TIGR00027 family)
MHMLNFDPALNAPLLHITWEQDQQFRMSSEVVSSLLREQVPVLEYVDWKVTAIEPGQATSCLPLNPQSTNQHFTHQAAMFVLSADYTGGTAVASLLTGWPVVGVHPVTSANSVSLWLLKAEVKYLRPSVTDLTVSAVIDQDRRDRIVKRFLAGKPVIETIRMQFHNGDLVVAEASATYFARQSTALRAEGLDLEHVNSLYELKLTSSAELIAGVRARESGQLFEDPYAERMAGQHGMALAARFCQRSPQLAGMVAARTRHLDEVVLNFVAAGGRQLVTAGVGWDMRTYRLPLPPGTRAYELDFPTTLRERSVRLAELEAQAPPGVERVSVPIDLRTMSLAKTLAGHLNPEEPVLILWEGMCMYFEEQEVVEILSGMVPLLSHSDSLLWLDIVRQEPLVAPERFSASVQEFLRGMQILGEPFTFGCDRPEAFLASCGLRCWERVASDAYFASQQDPVYAIYQFCVAGSGKPARSGHPPTFQPARIEGAARVRAPHFPLADRSSNQFQSPDAATTDFPLDAG